MIHPGDSGSCNLCGAEILYNGSGSKMEELCANCKNGSPDLNDFV